MRTDPQDLGPVRAARSWLFTPGTKPPLFGRAASAGADAVIYDLEDSVAAGDKDLARGAVLDHLIAPRSDTVLRAVRINSVEKRWGQDDLAALSARGAAFDVLVIPKVETPGQLDVVWGLMAETHPKLAVAPIVESALGVRNLRHILSGGTPVGAVMIGAADLAADLGARPTWGALAAARGNVIIDAAVAGITVIDSPYFDHTDGAGLANEVQLALESGFMAKAAIHPDQIAVINAAWTPSEDQIDWAQRVLDVNRAGVGTVDGQMVDEAVARRARRVLTRVR